MGFKFNVFTGQLDLVNSLFETILHSELSDMPDVGGTNSDHDSRYYTETELSASGGSALIGDHNGHTVHDTFNHILNRGKSSTITISLDGGLDVSWTSGEIYDEANNLFISTISGSGTLTDNSANYLKWISGTGLTLSTAISGDDEILITIFTVYDGVINGYRETSIMSESVANTRRGLREIIPVRIISGMSVSEDTDVTNALDVTMDAGVFWCCGIEKLTPIEIKSRNTAMIRHFHTAGVWDYDTNAEIDTVNYDNGTDKTAIPLNKWVKAYFIYMNGKIGWIYPTTYYNTEAQALIAPIPASPPGLDIVPKLTAIVYKQGNADFTQTTWQDIRAGISEVSFSGVSDHGALAGLADNDHPQYFLVDGQSSNIVNGTFDLTTTGDLNCSNSTVNGILDINMTTSGIETREFSYLGVFNIAELKGTGADTALSISNSLLLRDPNDSLSSLLFCDSNCSNFSAIRYAIPTRVLSFNSASSYTFDNDLTITGTLTATGYNDANWNTAYTHSQDNSQAHSDYLINNGDDTTSGTITAGGFTTTGDINLGVSGDGSKINFVGDNNAYIYLKDDGGGYQSDLYLETESTADFIYLKTGTTWTSYKANRWYSSSSLVVYDFDMSIYGGINARSLSVGSGASGNDFGFAVGYEAYAVDHAVAIGSDVYSTVSTGIGIGEGITQNSATLLLGFGNEGMEFYNNNIKTYLPMSFEDDVTTTHDLTVGKKISSGTLTVTASSDNLDVSGVNTVFVNITSNIILGGLTGGVDGQVLNIVYKGNYTATCTIEDTEGVGDQDFYLHTRADETIDGGGFTFVCDGSNFFDSSDARHV